MNFFVEQGILRHVDFDIVKCVLIASPGFLKDDFFKYLMEEAVRQDKKILLQNKSVFLLVHSSSGHKQALDEVMLDPVLTFLMNVLGYIAISNHIFFPILESSISTTGHEGSR